MVSLVVKRKCGKKENVVKSFLDSNISNFLEPPNSNLRQFNYSTLGNFS